MITSQRSIWLDVVIAATIGSVSGAIGYLFLGWTHKTLQISGSTTVSLVAVVVTVIGWLVSQRNGRQLFVHQVKNAARLEIVAAVRQHQEALEALRSWLFSLSINSDAATWSENQWKTWRDEFRTRRSAIDKMPWVFVLEQYVALFAPLNSGLMELRRFSKRVFLDLENFSAQVGNVATRAAATVQAGTTLRQRLTDETLLMEDLLLFVQNEALGEIVGRRASFEALDKPTRTARLMLRGDRLVIIDQTGNQMFLKSR